MKHHFKSHHVYNKRSVRKCFKYINKKDYAIAKMMQKNAIQRLTIND